MNYLRGLLRSAACVLLARRPLHPPRIIFAGGLRLTALNANTGKLDPGFGKEGEVGMGIGYNGVPTIFKNAVMVGAATGEYVPLGVPGDSRAYDARTGGKLWEFHRFRGWERWATIAGRGLAGRTAQARTCGDFR
jgi:hypothetical protein